MGSHLQAVTYHLCGLFKLPFSPLENKEVRVFAQVVM